MNNIEYKEWEHFKGDAWKTNIDVASFIKDNYTEYTGDDSFLSEPTEKTKKVLSKIEKLLQKEMKLGLLDVDLKNISGINSFKPGFIDKKNEGPERFRKSSKMLWLLNSYHGTQ